MATLRSGDDIKTVQGNLGHATATFTQDVYGHVTMQMKEVSAAHIEKQFPWDKAKVLNNAEKLLGCGSVGLIVLSIRRFHFQLYDIFVQLSCSLRLQLAL